jgi:uncharacterized small protein (DUF1192 family)
MPPLSFRLQASVELVMFIRTIREQMQVSVGRHPGGIKAQNLRKGGRFQASELRVNLLADRNETGAMTMSDNLSRSELDDRIAILRDNIRQLVEQAAAVSGAQNEERTADRIAQQEAELDKLVAQRDALDKK